MSLSNEIKIWVMFSSYVNCDIVGMVSGATSGSFVPRHASR